MSNKIDRSLFTAVRSIGANFATRTKSCFFRYALTFALGALICLAVGAARRGAVNKIIEAERFVLLDDAGKMRARLGLLEDGGESSLWFFDQNGEARLTLSVNKSGSPAIQFAGTHNDQGILITTNADGGSPLMTMQGKGERKLHLDVADGSAGISVAKGKELRVTIAFDENESVIAILGEGNQPRVTLHVGPDGKPSLTLAGKNGKKIVELPPK